LKRFFVKDADKRITL
jgi:hypothetical protein